MSVTMCVFCDEFVDTDFHETCTSCERDPFGEYMFCGTCVNFIETPDQPLRAYSEGKCKLTGKAISDCDEACKEYEDAEY